MLQGSRKDLSARQRLRNLLNAKNHESQRSSGQPCCCIPGAEKPRFCRVAPEGNCICSLGFSSAQAPAKIRSSTKRCETENRSQECESR